MDWLCCCRGFSTHACIFSYYLIRSRSSSLFSPSLFLPNQPPLSLFFSFFLSLSACHYCHSLARLYGSLTTLTLPFGSVCFFPSFFSSSHIISYLVLGSLTWSPSLVFPPLFSFYLLSFSPPLLFSLFSCLVFLSCLLFDLHFLAALLAFFCLFFFFFFFLLRGGMPFLLLGLIWTNFLL